MSGVRKKKKKKKRKKNNKEGCRHSLPDGKEPLDEAVMALEQAIISFPVSVNLIDQSTLWTRCQLVAIEAEVAIYIRIIFQARVTRAVLLRVFRGVVSHRQYNEQGYKEEHNCTKTMMRWKPLNSQSVDSISFCAPRIICHFSFWLSDCSQHLVRVLDRV